MTGINGSSYTLLNPGSTLGKPLTSGSPGSPLLAMPALGNQFGFAEPELNELKVLLRLVRRNSTFTPNCSVCFPFVQETSSVRLCTGTWKTLSRTTWRLELLEVWSSFKPRNRMNG